MFEVTIAKLKAIAIEEINIASALVAEDAAVTVGTAGATSPRLAISTAALFAAKAALASALLAEKGAIEQRLTSAASAVKIGQIAAKSAASSAALNAQVASWLPL
jgi:hypothetical protein